MNAATEILGVMSGSSLDGVDFAVCRFAGDPAHPRWDILHTRHLPYSSEWKSRLGAAHELSGRELMKLDADLGRLIGEEALRLVAGDPPLVSLIASHGHTVYHDPDGGFSTQLGDGAWIAAVTGIDTITSFRGMDVALGGQGAPFAPAADNALFPAYAAHLNLGGIANVHLHGEGPERLAWDIGPCNQALNFLAERAGHAYDPEGRIARSGQVDEALLASLLVSFPPGDGGPRGLSNDTVRRTWIHRLQTSSHSIEDLLATTTEAIARMITAHIIHTGTRGLEILVTGGGAYNAWLVERLQHLGASVGLRYVLPRDSVIQFKECLLMAYLGWLVRLRRPFGIAHLTGATRESVGGAYYIGRHGS